MNLKIFLVLIPLVTFLSFQEASAAPFTFNVDGVITDSSGNPLEANPVIFQIDIKNSAETCILYRETFSVDMTGSNGYFSIPLGKQTNLVAGGYTLEKVFSNQGANIPGQSCTYTPSSAAETRKIVISFNDGSTSQTFSTQEIQSVPFALESVQASKVGDYAASNLLKAATSVNQTTYPNSALTQTQYDEFWRLITNPLAAYLPTTGDVTIVSGNNRVTTFLGQSLPAGPASNGQVLVSNGTSWTLQSMSSGSVTSVGGTAPISSSGGATPSISISQANTTQDGYLSSTDWNTFNSKQSSALTSSSIWVGNSSGGAEARTLSGDATISNTGVLTLSSTITAGGPVGTSGYVPVITYDAKGRLTAVTSAAVNDSSKLPLAGGTMTGDIAMGGNKITGLTNVPNVTTNPAAGQNGQSLRWNNSTTSWEWFTASAAGAAITSLGGQTGASQSFGAIDLGTSVTAPAWSSASDVHTLKIPMASNTSVTAGLIAKTDYDRIGVAEKISGKSVDTASASTLGQILFYDSVADKWKVSASVAPSDGQVLKWNNTAKTWEPGSDAGGWSAVDASYSTKGIVQFDTDAAISGINISTGVASVVRTTTGEASKILQLDSNSVATTKGVNVNGATSGSISIRGQAAAGTYTLTLPNSAGSTNQFLQTDGSGNLSWANQSAALPSINAGLIWVGNASNGPEARTLSGDVSAVSNTGSVTVVKTTTAENNKILALNGSGVGTMKGLEIQTGTGKATIQTSGAFTDYVLTLPSDDGAANQVLKTDGNGILSWVSVLTGVSNTADLADAKIWIGNASGKAMEVSMSGDATMSNAGVLTLVSTITAGGPVGTSGYVPVITYDAKGRLTAVTSAAVNDTSKLPLAGGTMTGPIAMGAQDITSAGNISMAANKYFTLSANSTNGTAAGQMWYDAGTIKYFDGSTVKSLGIQGAGITSLNGLTNPTQSFALDSSGSDALITSSGSTHTLSLPSSSASNRGLLTSADWSTFNSKQSNALSNGNIWVGNSSGGAEARAISGDATMDNTGLLTVVKTQSAAANKILQLTASSVAVTKGEDIGGAGAGSVSLRYPNTATNTTLTFPSSAGSVNQVLQTNGSGVLSWASVLTDVSNTADLTDSKIWVGNASGKAQQVSISGDATLDNTGLLTLSSAITNSISAKLPLTGGTMTGSINMGNQDITNAGNISMAANKYFTLSDNSTNGTVAGQMWYSSGTIKYFDGSTVKSLGVSGAGITNLNGLISTTQSFASPGTSGNAPNWSSSGSDHTLNIPMASASGSVTAGLLSNAEYVALSAKQSNTLGSANIWVGNSSGGAQARAMSGDVTMDNTGLLTVDKTQSAAAGKILQLDSNSVATTKGVNVNGATSGSIAIRGQAAAGTYTLTLPNSAGSTNQFLQTDGAGNLSWANQSAALPSINAGLIWVGNASNGPEARTLSGDVSAVSNTGSVTVVKTTTAENNKILALNGSGVGTMKGLEIQTGTGKATIQTSGAFTDYVLTLPSDDGAANQVLKTDGNGILSWASVLTGVSNTANLSTGKIWVGNAGIAQEVAISGDATMDASGNVTLATVAVGKGGTGATSLAANALLVGNNSSPVSFLSPTAGNVIYGGAGPVWSSGTPDTAGLVDKTSAQTIAGTKTFQFSDATNGIGAPITLQRMRSDATAPGAGFGSALTYLLETSTNNSSATAGSIATQWELAQSGAASQDSAMVFSTSLDGTTAEKMRISSAGNVGIGTSTPGAPLDVKGAIRMSGATSGYTGFQPAAAAGSTIWTLPTADGTNGQVLTTNGSGVLSWSPPSSGGITSLNGLSTPTQSFATPGTSGTAPQWSSSSSSHTLNIPMANTTSVTAGLISKTEYDTFNSKLGTGTTYSGDVSGTYNAMSVDKIQGKSIVLGAYSTGQHLRYDGTNWVNALVALSTDVTGTLPVANGGTGAATLGAGNILIGNGTSAVTSLAAASSGNVVYATGASSWASGSPETAGLVDKSSTQTISGAKAFTNYLQMSAQNATRYADSDSSHFVALRGPATVTTNVTLTLPATAGSSGQMLSTDGAGVLSWAPVNDSSKLPLAGGTMTGNLTVSGANVAVNTGQVYASQNIVTTGATVSFNTGNVQILQSPGSSAITLNDMQDGGSYTLIITDTTSRMYTFTNCANSHFVPANDVTTAGSHTIYTITKVTIGGTANCYISWVTGF